MAVNAFDWQTIFHSKTEMRCTLKVVIQSFKNINKNPVLQNQMAFS